MNLSQVRKLNTLWAGREESKDLEERIKKLEKALLLLAEATDERLSIVEQKNG